ncbi:MAG: hypothetical protein ABH872_03640 [Candidatus Omnitrophota bacterium]
MRKYIYFTLMFLVISFAFGGFVFAQNDWDESQTAGSQIIMVEGEITEIAQDASFIVVRDGVKSVKLNTEKEFIEEAYMEVGDKLKVYAEQTENGLRLVDYEYVDDSYTGKEAENQIDSENIPSDY